MKKFGACTPIYYEWPLILRLPAQLGLFVHLRLFRNRDRSRELLVSMCRVVLKILPHRDLPRTTAFRNGDILPLNSPFVELLKKQKKCRI